MMEGWEGEGERRRGERTGRREGCTTPLPQEVGSPPPTGGTREGSTSETETDCESKVRSGQIKSHHVRTLNFRTAASDILTTGQHKVRSRKVTIIRGHISVRWRVLLDYVFQPYYNAIVVLVSLPEVS